MEGKAFPNMNKDSLSENMKRVRYDKTRRREAKKKEVYIKVILPKETKRQDREGRENQLRKNSRSCVRGTQGKEARGCLQESMPSLPFSSLAIYSPGESSSSSLLKKKKRRMREKNPRHHLHHPSCLPCLKGPDTRQGKQEPEEEQKRESRQDNKNKKEQQEGNDPQLEKRKRQTCFLLLIPSLPVETPLSLFHFSR